MERVELPFLREKSPKSQQNEQLKRFRKVWFIDVLIFVEGVWPSALSLHDPVCE